MKSIFNIILCTAILCFLLAATSLYSYAQVEVITNQTIVQLQKAGLSKDLIKAKIDNSSCTFDLSTDALLALKKAGVADEVVTAMFAKNNVTPVTTKAEYPVNLESGVYFYNAETSNYEEMDASILTNTKEGGLGENLKRSVSGLFSAKNRVSLGGSEAHLKIATTSPLFVFVFEKEKGSLNKANNFFSNATSPNEFFLVKLTATKNSREVVVGKYNNVSVDIGIADNVKVAFTSKKLQKGIYEVTTDKPLPPGEYCFMFASSVLIEGVTHKVFDFSIKI